ncbi:hypothetical protein V490_09146, partial [Pseudogymnoascus sp. VKM F-3557]
MPVTDMGRSAVPGRGAAAGEGSSGGAAHEDGNAHREGGRVRDGAQKLARRPPPKFRRTAGGVAVRDELGAEIKELGSALRDASLAESPVPDPIPKPRSVPPKTLRANEKPNTILEELFPEYKEALSGTTSTDPKPSTDDLPKLDPSTLGLPPS